MYIVMDTETTGKPKNYKAPVTDLDNWPRVIQLAFAVFDAGGDMKINGCFLIKPDGWEIPKEKFWIDNGYSTEKNLAEGVEMPKVLKLYLGAIESYNVTTLICHNVAFDYPVLGAEFLRYGIKGGRKLQQFCTMEAGTDIAKIPGAYGKYKWPSLIELHQKLFNRGFDGAHDAMNDVFACAACFFEMKYLASRKS